jgi:hypothetical protein
LIVKKVVYQSVSAVWILLVALTVISWTLGSSHDVAFGHTGASVLILVVAVVKVRFVGLFFMELRNAPWPLRIAFEVYCVVLIGVLCTMFVFE